MIHYIYGDNLAQYPTLAHTMFRDRAKQFHDRLRWEAVTVDERGWERDEYDDLNPLYVIAESGGRHEGSMRFLPTTGRTMIRDHFAEVGAAGVIQSPFVWEATRFCLAPGASPQVSAALFLATGEIARGWGVTQCLGVFEARMLRVYAKLGFGPEVLGTEGPIGVGLWTYDEAVHARLAETAGVDLAESQRMFAASDAVARRSFEDA